MRWCLVCSQGHSWEVIGTDDPPQREHLTCPVCGAPAGDVTTPNPISTSNADIPTTLETGQVEPGPRSERWPAIPGYDILGELGRGGMGVVYQARQRALNRRVALKMIRPHDPVTADVLARFRIEAEAVARMQHPNIVQIHEIGEHAGMPFFSLELVEGGSLRDHVAGTPQQPRWAAELVETLARAMHAAHQKGIVHRDLKPANVLMQIADLRFQIADLKASAGEAGSGDPRPARGDIKSAILNLNSEISDLQSAIPKITDFGLAKQLDADSGQTRSGAILGTPSYMAPEQAFGRLADIGPRTDVYALGAILFELLTGRPPFRGPTVLDTLDQVRHQEPVPPSRLQPKLPRDLETICLKCLQKQPNHRYGSAQLLAADLRRFLHNEPILARPASAAYHLLKFAQRHKAPVVGAAAVAVALVAGLIGTGTALVRARNAEAVAVANLGRATTAEQGLRRELAASHLRTARLAAQRGDWRTAIRSYDLALDMGPEDEVEVRLRRAQAWMALNDPHRAEQELAALTERADLGPHAGEVLLARGDFALARFSGREQALADVRAGLARGLDPANAAYARGLLTGYPDEAAEHFQEALRHDPFHHHANTTLLATLFFLGRREECKARAEALRLLYPEDPSPRVMKAFILLLEGNAPAGRAELSAIRAQLGAGKTGLLDELFVTLEKVLKVIARADAYSEGEGLGIPEAMQFAALASKFADNPNLTELGLGFANLPALANSWGVLYRAQLRLLLGPSAEATRELEKVLDHHPDALFYYWHAHSLTLQLDGKKGDEQARLFRKAERSYRLATEVPCLVWKIARDSRFWAAYAEAILAHRRQASPDPEMHARAVRNLRVLLHEGDLTPAECGTLAEEALTRLQDADLTRALLAQGLSQAPNDLALLRLRARTELAAEAYHPALKAAEQVLARHKDDPVAVRCRREALARLRDLSKHLSAGP